MARSGGALVSSANCASILVKSKEGYTGQFMQGVINTGETPKPGTVMQIDPTQSLVGGRFVWKAFTRDADGNHPKGPYIVLLEDRHQGKTPNDAYAAGELCFGYVPQAGDELNMLFNNVSGTADDIAAGDLAVVDTGTGKLNKTTGSPEEEPFMFLETYTDPTADKLLWAIFCG